MTRLAAGPLADVHEAEERRDALSLEAVEMSRRLGDPATLAYALDGRWTAIWDPDTLDERRGVARGVVDSADAAGDKELLHDGHIWCALAGLESGDMSVVDSELEAQARLATELRQPAQLWFGVVLRATLATFEGRFADAEELIPRAAALARSAGLIADVYRTVQLWALRREQGRLDEVAPALTDAIHRYRMYDVLRSIGVHVAMELGHTHDARESLGALTADGLAASLETTTGSSTSACWPTSVTPLATDDRRTDLRATAPVRGPQRGESAGRVRRRRSAIHRRARRDGRALG